MEDKQEDLTCLMGFVDKQITEIMGERVIFSIVIDTGENGAYHLSNVDMDMSIDNMETAIRVCQQEYPKNRVVN